MRKNPQIIRPKPEDVTTVWNEVRRCAREVYEEVLDLPFRKIQPKIKTIRRPSGSSRIRSIGLDWSLGDKIRFVPRGGEFELYFGPDLSANQVVSMSKQSFNNKYGPRYDTTMVEDVRCHVNNMARSCLVSQVASLFRSKSFFVHTSDYIGKDVVIKFSFEISKVSDSMYGAYRSEGGVDSTRSNIFIGINGDWSIGSILSKINDHKNKVVLSHELTHAIDPGIRKEKYAGTASSILGVPWREAESYVSMLDSLGHHYEADAYRARMSRAFSSYASGSHEVRAEAGANLQDIVKYATLFRSMFGKNMGQADLVLYANSHLPMYAWMNDDGQTRFLRYIAQALREQGLMDLLVQEELFPQRLDADLALVLVQLDGPRGTEPDDGDALRQDLLDHVADPSAADDPGTFAYLRHQYTSLPMPIFSRRSWKYRSEGGLVSPFLGVTVPRGRTV